MSDFSKTTQDMAYDVLRRFTQDYRMLKLIFAVLILIGKAHHVTCQTGANAKALRTKLFVTDAYDYRIRPTDDQSAPISITVDLYLLAINELNEAQETLKTTAYLSLIWNDVFLTWAPGPYGGIDYSYWPQGEVWKPDIALKNSILDYKQLGEPSLNVFNRNDGEINWNPFQVLESTCSIDITNFPFDYQTCELKFQAWSYSKSEVFMVGGSKGIEMTEYEPNSGWEIVNSSWKIEEDSDDSTISFSLTIKRKPLYFMLSVLLPIITLAILNICVFLLPVDSGEKASYSITVFLAFAVFLTIVSSTLPKNSDSVAMISIFLIIQTLCSTLITIFALALLRMFSFDETTAIPRLLIMFMRCLKCKACAKGSKVAPNNVAKITNAESEMSDASSVCDVEYTWKEVVNFLDAVLFVVFTAILVGSALGCLLIASLASKP